MKVIKLSEYQQFASDKMKKNNIFETPRFFCDVYCFEPGQEQKGHVHDGEKQCCHDIGRRRTARRMSTPGFARRSHAVDAELGRLILKHGEQRILGHSHGHGSLLY